MQEQPPFPKALDAVRAYLEKRRDKLTEEAAMLMAQYEVYADNPTITNREEWIVEAVDKLGQVQVISAMLEALA